jgi:SPP1 family phage portal protein
MSDSMNEFDRFAFAYLILKNLNMDSQEMSKIKERRVFELFDNGEAAFLQKEIPSEYIQFMSEWIRKEIHKQTHVPDFTDTSLGTEMTGAAIDRMFYDFEFVAADKEDRFRDALRKRFELVNTILRKTSLGGGVIPEAYEIDIVMSRNKPMMLKELAETGALYMGRISQKTYLEEFAPFVDDADEEIQAVEDERGPYRGLDANQGFEEEPTVQSEEAQGPA